MPEYHDYHIDIEEVDGQTSTRIVPVHEDHHRAHGFDGGGNLKNTAAMVTIVAGAIGIAEAAVKGFKYFGKTRKG